MSQISAIGAPRLRLVHTNLGSSERTCPPLGASIADACPQVEGYSPRMATANENESIIQSRLVSEAHAYDISLKPFCSVGEFLVWRHFLDVSYGAHRGVSLLFSSGVCSTQDHAQFQLFLGPSLERTSFV